MRYILLIFCLFGCVYQIHEISENYFMYSTDTEVKVKVDEQVDNPKLSVCFNLFDLLNEEFKQKRGLKSLDDGITVREAFENTPSAVDMIDRCMVRFPGKYQIKEMDRKSCSENLRIKKYLQRNDICYHFEVKANDNEETPSAMIYSFASEDFNVVFGIIFNDSVVSKSSDVYAYAHEKNTSETVDAMFTQVLKLGKDQKFKLVVAYGLSTLIRLPSPYVTDCLDYTDGALSRAAAVHDCVQQKFVHKLNRSSFSQMVEEELDVIMMTLHDFENETIANMAYEIEKECVAERHFNSCKLKFTHSFSKIVPADEFAVYLTIPQTPSVQVQHRPSLDLVQYLVLILSCIGTWLGLSLLTILEQFYGVGDKLLRYYCCQGRDLKKHKQEIRELDKERKKKREEILNVFWQEIEPKLVRDMSRMAHAMVETRVNRYIRGRPLNH